MEEIKVKDHTEWHGEYRGIRFDVVKWKNDYTGHEDLDRGYTWNYYIYVKPRQMLFADGWKEGTKRMDYSAVYDDVEMHGGITFCEEVINSSLHKSHKIGCDYAHSWDSEPDNFIKLKENKLEWVLKDVQKTIDNLPVDLIPTPQS